MHANGPQKSPLNVKNPRIQPDKTVQTAAQRGSNTAPDKGARPQWELEWFSQRVPLALPWGPHLGLPKVFPEEKGSAHCPAARLILTGSLAIQQPRGLGPGVVFCFY